VFAGLAGVGLALNWTGSATAEDSKEGTDATIEGPESVSERGYPLDRYASLWEKSLFFSAVPAAVPDAAFARDYSLAGVFEMNGATTAALVSKRDQSVVNISDSADTAGAGGMRLIAVESAGNPTQARVQVEKEGQRAWIPVAPSAAPAGAATRPTAAMSINRNAGTESRVAPGLPESLENFPVPVAPRLAPNPAVDPAKSGLSSEGAPPPPMPPSPLDAAMAGEEEIIVPMPDGG